MRIKLGYIVGLLFALILQSCSQSNQNSVLNSTKQFLAALKAQDIAGMRVVYPDIDNLDIFYASDTAFIESITPLDSNGYRVDVVSFYLNEEKGLETQNIIFFFYPASVKSSVYQIKDSYGVSSWTNYPHYKFALQTGCLASDAELSDQQAMYRLRVAKDLLFYFSKLMYQDLEEHVRIINPAVVMKNKLGASGEAVVENLSEYTLPDLRYKIIYYDDDDRKIAEDTGWVTQQPLESGQKVHFKFATSFDQNASTADFQLDFDLNLILEFVLHDDIYTGEEYKQFITKKLINI